MTAPRSIFITGAGAGIGEATVRLFAGRGWRVGAADVDAARLAALQRALGTERIATYVVDVRDFAAIETALRDFTAGADGRLDAVFANAGVLFMGPHEEIGRAQKDLLVDVNVRGVLHTIDAAFPHLKRTPGAHAVAMCSTSAEYGAPEHAVYSATKFFVRGLTEALDIEWRRHGVQVSAIYVAYVQTGMVLDAPVKPASIERLGVKVTPQQVAEAAWRAVHGNRSHWRVGMDARLLNLATRLLGSRMASVSAWLMRR
jgi:NADP-dependent 3-hydroxy acid dehydrogenase YdfG